MDIGIKINSSFIKPTLKFPMDVDLINIGMIYSATLLIKSPKIVPSTDKIKPSKITKRTNCHLLAP